MVWVVWVMSLDRSDHKREGGGVGMGNGERVIGDWMGWGWVGLSSGWVGGMLCGSLGFERGQFQCEETKRKGEVGDGNGVDRD